MIRHHVTIHCNGQTRSAMLTNDEIETLWSYAKGLVLPETKIKIGGRGVEFLGNRITWCRTGKNLTFASGLPETTGQGVK